MRWTPCTDDHGELGENETAHSGQEATTAYLACLLLSVSELAFCFKALLTLNFLFFVAGPNPNTQCGTRSRIQEAVY